MLTSRTPGLTRLTAIPLAFGSIAGSGILSLPAAVYSETGAASLTVWVIAAAICLPMLFMFRDAMSLSGEGDAVQTLVARGLRPWVGHSMPLMFVFVVVIGLPTGAIIAGRYVEVGLARPGVTTLVAIALLTMALLSNLFGSRIGEAVQLAGSGILVLTGILLIVYGLGTASQPIDVVPQAPDWGRVMPGVLLAFWAFVGFENLTFLGRDLRHPAKDFLAVSIAALAIYGSFAIALTLTIAATVEQRSVDPLTGLLQLATNPTVQAGVAVVALAAMLINAAAWVRGVDQLIAAAARGTLLPYRLAASRPLRTALLGGAFAVAVALLTQKPELTVDALAASSAVFVLIYLTCTIGYIRTAGLTVRTCSNALLVPVMTAALLGSGTRSIYGLVVAAACLTWGYLRRSPTPPECAQP